MANTITNTLLYSVCQFFMAFTNGKESKGERGTCFFINKDDKIYLITNKHLIDVKKFKVKNPDFNFDGIYVDRRVFQPEVKGDKPEEYVPAHVETEMLKLKGESKFVFPDDSKDDIVCIYDFNFETKPKLPGTCIRFEELADTNKFQNVLNIGDPIITIGYPQIYDHKNNMPIVRSGIISSDPRLNYSVGERYDGHMMAMEIFSTPGASGSPVFVVREGFKHNEETATVQLFQEVFLIGINAGNLRSETEVPEKDNDGKISNKYQYLHQNMAYMFKSDEIIKLIEKAENRYKKIK